MFLGAALLLAGCGALGEDTAPPEQPEPVVQGASSEEEVSRYSPRGSDPRDPEHRLDDPSGTALQRFYESLARSDDGVDGAITRVTHMGDSSIGMDQLPHFLRTRFQDRFGDGGAGFVLAQPHSPNYRNQTVHLSNPVNWDFCFVAFQCMRDGHYGLGGVVAQSNGGSTTVVRTRRNGQYGRNVSRLELWYAGRPRGGSLELRIDQDEPILVRTAAEMLEDRWHEAALSPGEHRIRLRAAGGGPVRAYGLVLETDGPGVVWDTLSMIGAFTVRVLLQDPAHFRRQLERRRSDLVVLGYGGNDLRRYVGGVASIEQFQEETRQLLSRVRDAGASCLLTGVVEHERSGPTRISPDDVQAVVDAQRSAAEEAGCAFFDVYQAMGGAGGFRNWMREGLASTDLKHLNRQGREVLAGWMYDAIVSDYIRYRTERAPH